MKKSFPICTYKNYLLFRLYKNLDDLSADVRIKVENDEGILYQF